MSHNGIMYFVGGVTSGGYNPSEWTYSAATNRIPSADYSANGTFRIPLLDRLERLGYILRERSNIDRRMVKVTITEKGRGVLDSLKDPVSSCHQRQFAQLGEHKLRQLSELLKSVLGQTPQETSGAASGQSPLEKHPAL